MGAAEFPTHLVYLDGFVQARAQDAVCTERFAGGWTINAPHRVLRSSLEAAEAFDGDMVAERVDSTTGERSPVYRFQGDLPPTRSVTGHVETMGMWAGESVGGVTSVQPAAAIIQELVDEAEHLLGRWTAVPTPA